MKKKIKYGPAARAMYRGYPKLTDAILDRHDRYNETYRYIRDKELKGELFVIRPRESLGIGVSNKPGELQRVYDTGRSAGEAEVERVKEYLNG